MAVSPVDIRYNLLAHVKRTLVSGLLLLIPVALTYSIVSFLFDLVDGLLRPVIQWAFGHFGVDLSLPGPGLLAAILLIYLVGLVTAFGLGRRALDRVRSSLSRVPFIGTIYSTGHQLVESFSGTTNAGFQRVVLVEFPRAGTWSLGFLTGLSEPEGVGKLVMAYVPTAPLPNSGFVIFLPAECVLDTDLSVPEVMQLVFSGGVVSPATIKTRKIDIGQLEKDFQRPHAPDHSLADTVKEKILATAAGTGRATKTSAKRLGMSSHGLARAAAIKELPGQMVVPGVPAGAHGSDET